MRNIDSWVLTPPSVALERDGRRGLRKRPGNRGRNPATRAGPQVSMGVFRA
jgi:hypothetical protein